MTFSARRLPAVAAIALAAVLLVACTSAEERFEQGLELERSGESVVAAQRYVQALRQDPALGDARIGLRRVAPQALAHQLRQADADRARGDPVAAARSVLAADALLDAVRGVRVALAVPAGYAARRRGYLDGAIAHRMRDAAAAASAGRFDEALAALDGVAAFEPSPDQAAAAADARIRTRVRWAQGELAAGRYNAALALADGGLEQDAGAHRGVLEEIRRSALARGTVAVAFLPPAAGTRGPGTRAFVAALGDALELDHWTRPPPLVVPVDPIALRRVLRRAGGGAVTPGQAVDVARAVGAAFAVVPVLEGLDVDERGVREITREATTRRGARVSYRVRSGTRRIVARARYRVIDADEPAAVRGGRVSASRSERFEEPVYAGDPRELVLDAAARRAFRVAHGAGVADDGLAAELAARIAHEVFDDVLAAIP